MNETYATLIGIGVQTILYLLGGYAMVIRNDVWSKALKEKIDGMQKELQKLAEVVTMQAVQTSRLDNLTSQLTSVERRVEDLRRGNGYVRGRAAVDGEYDG